MGELKPLITINGKTFLRHIVDTLTQVGVKEIYVVVGYQANQVIEKSGVENIHFVVNNHYQHGQFSSLQAGIRRLGRKERGLIVCLVDQPQIKASWILRLTEAFYKNEPLIVVPKFQGKRGHPVIYSSELFEEILHMPPTLTAHALSKNHADRTLDVEIDESGILFDADRPEDLDTLRGEYFT